MAKKIKNFNELVGLSNENYAITSNDCFNGDYVNAWIKPIRNDEFGYYLSTHAFYGNEYMKSTEILQGYWDGI